MNQPQDTKGSDELIPRQNPDWESMQREYNIGSLRVLNEMINSANLIGAKEVTLEAIIRKRDSINKDQSNA